MNAAPNAQQQLALQNANARDFLHRNGYRFCKSIFSTSLSAIPATPIRIPVNLSGLLTGFKVVVKAQISNVSSNALTLQKLGAGNFFSRVEFVDFSGISRINTPGWHLQLLASAKRGHPFLGAFTSDSPLGIANNVTTVQRAPATITASAGGTNNFHTIFEVPVTKGIMDLTGIINAAQTGAQAYLNLTVNPAMIAISTANGVQSLYKSSDTAGGTVDAFSIEVYQEGFEQVGGVIPAIDASFMYKLTDSVETGLTANQETRVAFANNQQYHSLFSVYDNNGTLNAGTDVVRHKLQAANSYEWLNITPDVAAAFNRENFGGDLPHGCNYFNFNMHPISILQAGNVTYNFTPSAVTSGAKLLLAYESVQPVVNALGGTTVGAN